MKKLFFLLALAILANQLVFAKNPKKPPVIVPVVIVLMAEMTAADIALLGFGAAATAVTVTHYANLSAAPSFYEIPGGTIEGVGGDPNKNNKPKWRMRMWPEEYFVLALAAGEYIPQNFWELASDGQPSKDQIQGALEELYLQDSIFSDRINDMQRRYDNGEKIPIPVYKTGMVFDHFIYLFKGPAVATALDPLDASGVGAKKDFLEAKLRVLEEEMFDGDDPSFSNFEKILEKLEKKTTQQLIEMLLAEADPESIISQVIRTILLRRAIGGESIPASIFLEDGPYRFIFIEKNGAWVILLLRDNSIPEIDKTFLLIDDIMTDQRYVASVPVEIKKGKSKVDKANTNLKYKSERDQLEPDKKVFYERVAEWLKKVGLK